MLRYKMNLWKYFSASHFIDRCTGNDELSWQPELDVGIHNYDLMIQGKSLNLKHRRFTIKEWIVSQGPRKTIHSLIVNLLHFRCRPMPVPGLSLLGLKHIRGFVSILRYINPTIIIYYYYSPWWHKLIKEHAYITEHLIKGNSTNVTCSIC